MSWNWTQTGLQNRAMTIRLTAKDEAKEIMRLDANDKVSFPSDPAPEKIALFCRTFRLLNVDQEPDPKGSLHEVWRWLLGKAS